MKNQLSAYEQLLGLAARQRGYFSVQQALELGVSRRSVDYWRSQGRFVPVLRGVYRLAGYFDEGFIDDVWPVWLASGQDTIISHESALVLHGLSDLIPNKIHLSIPRSRRGRHHPKTVQVHTLSQPITEPDVTNHEGIPVTQIERTLIDCLTAHVQLDQIQLAYNQTIQHGMTTPKRLLLSANSRSKASQKRLKELVERSL